MDTIIYWKYQPVSLQITIELNRLLITVQATVQKENLFLFNPAINASDVWKDGNLPETPIAYLGTLLQICRAWTHLHAQNV